MRLASMGDIHMKSMLILAALGMAHSTALADPSEGVPPKPVQASSRDFFDARGRLIGSITMIGDVSYFTTPDGKVVGKATVVDGRRIYHSY